MLCRFRRVGRFVTRYWVGDEPLFDVKRAQPRGVMTKLDREFIFFHLASTECRRALDGFEEIKRLAAVRIKRSEAVEVRELGSVFDEIRFTLQASANVSKIFWPSSKSAAARGVKLRDLAGLPDSHPLSVRTLRNHMEHMDERIDDWTAVSPRDFLATEMILFPDLPDAGKRQEIIDSTAVVYDAATNEVVLFGDRISLGEIEEAVRDVQSRCSAATTKLIEDWPSITG